MKYLRLDLMKDAGVKIFDDWAVTFVRVVTKNSHASAGALKLKTGFAKFANLPN